MDTSLFIMKNLSRNTLQSGLNLLYIIKQYKQHHLCYVVMSLSAYIPMHIQCITTDFGKVAFMFLIPIFFTASKFTMALQVVKFTGTLKNDKMV